MLRKFHQLFTSTMLIAGAVYSTASELKSGEYFITQTWSQESEFKRNYFVHVPESGLEPLPLFIFLHGNGGNADRAHQGFLKRRPQISKKYITVFAQGYKTSWNIVSERSKAPDREFIEAIVEALAQYSNVKKSGVVLMGNSNGAAMVNQIAIETKVDAFSHFITSVSPLNNYQHDGKNFKAKGPNNNYNHAATPLKGKCLMNVSGVYDQLVPYLGGPSAAIKAKDSKLPFVAAEKSTFLWAQQYGYQGKQLLQATAQSDQVDVYSYLGGAVIHYKANQAGHGVGGVISETMLLTFLKTTNPSP